MVWVEEGKAGGMRWEGEADVLRDEVEGKVNQAVGDGGRWLEMVVGR